MYILGFNGPPRCGKDSMAMMVVDHMEVQGCDIPVKVDYLSLPLRQIAYQMVGYTGDLFGESYESFKVQQFGAFDARSGRELMIDVSERFLKPTYGIDIMARMLLQRNADFHGLLLVPDSGFMCEVQPLIDAVGENHFYVVRVHREGTDFNNDSREWVHCFHDTDVQNDGTLDDLRTEAGRIYGRLVNKMHWKL